MHRGPFEEGKAAAILHGQRDLNPYRKGIRKFMQDNTDAPSIYYEYASDWESGFIAGQAQANGDRIGGYQPWP